MVVKTSNWDPCPSVQALTRGLGKVQKLSATGGDSYQELKKGYFLKDGLLLHQNEWNTMEQGIQYLRELAMLEVLYKVSKNEQSPINAGEVTWLIALYTNHVAEHSMGCAIAICQLLGNDIMERRRTKIRSSGYQTQLYEESISFLIQACVLSMERLFEDLQKFKEVFHAPPVQNRIFCYCKEVPPCSRSSRIWLNHREKLDPPGHKFSFKTGKKNGPPLTAEGARKTNLSNTLEFQLS